MIVPDFIVDYCNLFKNCNGCKFQCVAPIDKNNYDLWLNEMINKIKVEVKRK